MPKRPNLPIWEERERPPTCLIDVHEDGHDLAKLPLEDAGKNDDYLAWINEFKEPLHDDLRVIHPRLTERLDARGINLAEVNEAVAHITGQPNYPLSRTVVGHDARNLMSYKAAADEGFFDRYMQGPTGPSLAEFEYILHFIRLRGSHVEKDPVADVTDTLSHQLGRASLSRITYVHVGRDPGDSTYHWYGYAWRHNDRYVGALLDEISGSRIAAQTRAELGLEAKGVKSPNPAVEFYREKKGIYYSAVGAVALDIINEAAGHKDPLTVHKLVWDFIANKQDEAVRLELAAAVSKATQGTVKLEEIETTP